MAKADTSVKWFHSGMADAPVLSGQAGKLIELLDACLINGFGPRTPDSIAVSGGVATVTISAGNPYEKHAVISISGASNAALNAEWRIDTAGASSFTFLCPGVADGAVTGASVKRAGAGWQKPHAATNLGVYQSQDMSATQMLLRVNDADARYVRVRGYEQMSDVNTGGPLFPTLTQLAETAFTWVKSSTQDATPRSWALIADGMFVYLAVAWHATYPSARSLYWFGDAVSFYDGDAFNTLIAAHETASPSNPSTSLSTNNATIPASPAGCFLARGSDQGGQARKHKLSGSGVHNFYGGTTSSATSGVAYVPADGNVVLHYPIMVSDTDMGYSPVRGFLPGIVQPLHKGAGLGDLVPFAGVGAFANKQLMTVYIVAEGSPGYSPFTAIFDVTGPWR